MMGNLDFGKMELFETSEGGTKNWWKCYLEYWCQNLDWIGEDHSEDHLFLVMNFLIQVLNCWRGWRNRWLFDFWEARMFIYLVLVFFYFSSIPSRLSELKVYLCWYNHIIKLGSYHHEFSTTLSFSMLDPHLHYLHFPIALYLHLFQLG